MGARCSGEVVVRPATVEDLVTLNEIYNHYVVSSHVTFDVEPITMAVRREWFTHYGTGRHRLLVAHDADRVLGYASSSPFRPKKAYETSVETSVYLASDAGRRGAGSALYAALFQALEGHDVHRAYAGIALPNTASIALHARFGFARVAYFSEQGRKLDRYWDVAWYEKRL